MVACVGVVDVSGGGSVVMGRSGEMVTEPDVEKDTFWGGCSQV